jgi:hypothetical protein
VIGSVSSVEWKMIKSAMVVVVVGVALTGCASRQERAMNACDSYGFARGTPEYAECIQNEHIAMENRAAAMRAAGVQMMQPYPAPSRPAQTQCIRQGVYVNCTTY